jgi:acyl dehydratase
MAVAALSIRTLLASASLPPGAVHAGQEITVHRAARTGERLAAAARIVSRGERQGWVLMSVDLSVTGAGGEPVMTGRATVTFPAPGQAKRPGWDGA